MGVHGFRHFPCPCWTWGLLVHHSQFLQNLCELMEPEVSLLTRGHYKMQLMIKKKSG